MLFKHSSKRSLNDTLIFNVLNKGNRAKKRTWVLKDEFEHLWDHQATWAAEGFLRRWKTTALKFRLQPMRDFVKIIRKHSYRILPYIGSKLTKAIAEGVSRIIRIIKINRASGFRHLKAFSDVIFLSTGDVDILRQIPNRFRAIQISAQTLTSNALLLFYQLENSYLALFYCILTAKYDINTIIVFKAEFRVTWSVELIAIKIRSFLSAMYSYTDPILRRLLLAEFILMSTKILKLPILQF